MERAKADATEFAITATASIFLTVLFDKEGYVQEDIRRIWGEVNELSDSVAKGYVDIRDLRRTLEDEYDILI